MKRLQLNTDDETLRDVLGNGKKYYIPKFQRDYSWKNEHWENLWDDMLSLDNGETHYHYMGYLVIQPPSEEEKEKGGKSKIVDGQQRLTTFSLIILAAIKRLKELENENERIDLFLKNFIGDRDLTHLRVSNKLELNRNNDYYYRRAVEGNDLPKRGKKRTIHLMEKALAYFYEQFKKYTNGEAIGKLIETISEKLLFTTIYIGDELNAYKVFETLNARGVQLSSADLLKNYIFSIVDKNNDLPDDILDEYDQQWEKIAENIGDNDQTGYILSEWNSRHKLVRKTELFKNIKREITTSVLAKEYLDILERKSDIYAALLNHENYFWKDHYDNGREIKNNLYFLKLFNIRQPISLLLAAYNEMPNEFSKILRWIKIFSLRYNVIGRKHTGEQEHLYNQISLLIKDGTTISKIKEKLLEICPTDDEFRQDFCDKSMPTRQSNQKARYLLARLEESSSNTSIDETTLTIEHVLPLKPDSEWIDYFGENWDVFNTRIGNMALVDFKINSQLGQKPFAEKKEILLNTSYNINENIADHAQWESENIASRQKKLANIAINLWKIN